MNPRWIQGFECALRAGDTGRAGQLEGSAGQLEGSPSGRPCRSYGARLLRAGASEGPASPGLAGGALLSRYGVARRLREAHSFYAHTQQPCRGPWQVMVYYREEGCAHCGDQESSMFRPSQVIPGSRCVPRSWLLAH